MLARLEDAADAVEPEVPVLVRDATGDDALDVADRDAHPAGELVHRDVDPDAEDFASTERIPAAPLKDLAEKDLRLSRDQFDQFLAEFA